VEQGQGTRPGQRETVEEERVWTWNCKGAVVDSVDVMSQLVHGDDEALGARVQDVLEDR